MHVLSSRRLTGPGLFLDSPGAVTDVTLDDNQSSAALAEWEKAARRLLDAVGWGDQKVASRRFHGGISLAISAPVDGLYSATEINEQAWEIAAAAIEGRPTLDDARMVSRLREEVAAERNPALVALRDAARRHNVTFLSDDDLASVGAGTGVMVWPVRSLPDPSAIEWSKVHDVPMALVTGSNGKTTVVRLLSAMVTAAGKVPGSTSTDGVQVGAMMIDEGDWSGPGGARLVLRRSEVETAILETARGGLLRRGLATPRADVAVITNIAEDHLGEFGVESLKDLAETKLLVGQAVAGRGYLVLNADDPVLVEASRTVPAQIVWFGSSGTSDVVRSHLERGGTAVIEEGEEIVIIAGGSRSVVIRTSDAPITFGGSARHNVANVLAAVGAAAGLGIGLPAVTKALRRFGQGAADNLGRANLIELGGARILVDYAHNAHGMSALVGMAQSLPADRRLLVMGQAGDRPDDAIRELARVASGLRPDRVILKDAEQYLRGRTPGEVPGILAEEFARLGTPASSISRTLNEIEGAREALAWARPGDLLIMTIHQDRRQILALFKKLESSGWRAGDPLPE